MFSDELIPGDVIQIKNGMKLTCDCVINRGSVMMNEASLTGENFPILRNAYVSES